MTQQTISIIGCGWLGLPLAEALLANGYIVKGSTTSAEKLPPLLQKGIRGGLLQLQPEPAGDLATLLQADVLIINIPPKAGKMGDEFHPQQVAYLVEAVRKSTIRHVIYVSSTSVYPELSREMVEEDVTVKADSAAPALVEAEQLVQSLEPDRNVTVLRCGGLMGYDRIPGKYVAGRLVDSGVVPVNYLHRDDAVRLLQTLIEQGIVGTYNAVAPEHPTREAVYRRSCADFGYALPTFVEPTQSIPYKTVSPWKVIHTTGYSFTYPNPLTFYYGRSN